MYDQNFVGGGGGEIDGGWGDKGVVISYLRGWWKVGDQIEVIPSNRVS